MKSEQHDEQVRLCDVVELFCEQLKLRIMRGTLMKKTGWDAPASGLTHFKAAIEQIAKGHFVDAACYLMFMWYATLSGSDRHEIGRTRKVNQHIHYKRVR